MRRAPGAQGHINEEDEDASSYVIGGSFSDAESDSSAYLQHDEDDNRKLFLLRIHKFHFEWELCMHITLCILSLAPFVWSGDLVMSIVPFTVWSLYNGLFMLGARRASQVLPGFDRFKRSFVSSIEEFMPLSLLPVLSLSFLCVVVGLMLTSQQLGGPPICLRSCRTCLRLWRYAIPIANESLTTPEGQNSYCGYENGKQLLALYTISLGAFIMFLAVVVGLLTCLAWRVAHEELEQQRAAEAWLKMENAEAFTVREHMMHQLGRPGSSVRPEAHVSWILWGCVGAVTFCAIGYKKWVEVPVTMPSVILIGVNVTITCVSVFLLHLAFYGRLIALYKRNLSRVRYLSHCLGGTDVRSWWHLRNFVLGEDLSLDYDIGGLGVSATFFIVLTSFLVALVQICKEGLEAVLSPPGSYCAYASVYLTTCLIRIFELATRTFQEQQSHIQGLKARLQEVGTAQRDEGRQHKANICIAAGGSAPFIDSQAANLNISKDEIEDMINQIIRFDPYPCILGIPVKPVLFSSSKVAIFLCFMSIGSRILYILVA